MVRGVVILQKDLKTAESVYTIKTNTITLPNKKEHPNLLNFCAAGPFVGGSHYFIFLVGLIISVLIVDCCKNLSSEALPNFI